ncbi:MAG: NTP transferase domain-containing protein [Clostridia bacterium]|nr:NTP transferase domain-containing protein [Clostridia bacterium]
MNIRAIIMAGGEGSRLRPMTMNLPKPLVPLLGKPVMSYTLELLKQHGIREAGVTLWYHPKKIRAAFGNGEKEGVQTQYFEETAPMGTAGSIRLAKDQLKETFFVLSGDGLTDCDLTSAMAYHKEKGALATLVLKRVKIPLPYGVVMTEEEGRIVRFVEKPDWSGVYSNLVNTGIYILEPEVLDSIPDHGRPDFGQDIFPLLLKKKAPLYGYEMNDYWCDVGNARAYLQAQEDLLQGRVKTNAVTGVHPQAVLGDDVHLQGCFYIGKGAVIEKGAVIRNAVIGDCCTVKTGAVVVNSSLWHHAFVGVKARISGSILCDGACVHSETVLDEGCVLGQGAAAGAHAHLLAEVKVWPGIRIPTGAVCAESRFREEGGGCMWEADGAVCRWAGNACRLAMAFAKVVQTGCILTGHDHAPALQAVVTGTLAAAGIQVLQGGWMTESMLRENVVALKADGGILAVENKLIFVDRYGRRSDSSIRRKMDAFLLTDDVRPEGGTDGAITPYEAAEEVYFSKVLPDGENKALFSPVCVYCDDERLLQLVLEGLKKLQVKNVRIAGETETELAANETGFLLHAGGSGWTCFTRDGSIEKTQLNLLRLKAMESKWGKVFDLPDVPRTAVQWMQTACADNSAACCMQERRMQDGVAAVWELCTLMKNGPLKELMQNMPAVHMICRDVACPEGEKSRILYELCRHTALPYTLSRGMQVKDQRGYATIVPDQERPAVRIYSEAASMETARELCDFYDRAIRMVLREKTDF